MRGFVYLVLNFVSVMGMFYIFVFLFTSRLIFFQNRQDMLRYKQLSTRMVAAQNAWQRLRATAPNNIELKRAMEKSSSKTIPKDCISVVLPNYRNGGIGRCAFYCLELFIFFFTCTNKPAIFCKNEAFWAQVAFHKNMLNTNLPTITQRLHCFVMSEVFSELLFFAYHINTIMLTIYSF